MKILITGARGMLASDLIPHLEQAHDVIPFSEFELDITDLDILSIKAKEAKPELIINCAAYTKVDDAEKEKDLALNVNNLGAKNIALICAERKIPLCHISTDYVFDGNKNAPYSIYDKPNPINFYGRTKLEGEQHIQNILKDFYIIRTSGLYGIHGANFVSTIMKIAKVQSNIKVVSDQITAPTSTLSLAQGIKILIESSKFGLYHLTDDSKDGISWYDFAKEIISEAGINSSVIPISTEEFPRPAKRPKYSVLANDSIKNTVDFHQIQRKTALKKFLEIRT
ncbi:MAG: dTDP-4-dehydrorhamnose reductase [Nitrospiraceae bacterium]|nr:dTDP-4-dehydrorhamnose reductase [Nitrospiraceae bacterium]